MVSTSPMGVRHPRKGHRRKEEAQAIGRAQAFVLLGEERRPGPERDAGEASLRGFDDRPRADRRHVDAQVLPALRGLDKDAALAARRAAKPRTAQAPYPAEHPVGALRSLDGEHAPVRDNRGLTDVEGGQRAQEIEAHGDRELVMLVRREVISKVGWNEEFRCEFMGSDDTVAMVFQKPHGAAQDLIVAPFDDIPDIVSIAQERGGAQQGREAGPAHGADEGHEAGSPCSQRGDDGLKIEEVDHGMCATADLRLHEAAEGKDAVVPPLALEALDEPERELAGACKDRDGVGHHAAPTGSRGMQSARSLPLRMKSRISCTNGWVANSPATSFTRSDRVPSSANRSR